MPPRMLWVTDPWNTLDHPRDTTLRLIEEAVGVGVECCWADVRTTQWVDHQTTLETFRVVQVDPARTAESFALVPLGPQRPSDFALVSYRPDPPVDLAYLHPLGLLTLDVEQRALEENPHGTEIVNPPPILSTRSEKLLAALVPGAMPPSMVGAQWEALQRFGEAERTTIAKPLHDAQSKGVELLSWSSTAEIARNRIVLSALTDEFRRPVMLQRYFPGVMDGETRLWLVDGNLLAAVTKKPDPGSFRIDMDKGGTLLAHSLTPQEEKVVNVLRPWLAHNGVRVAAVDLIEGWITDFNFTSPGLIPAMEVVLGCNLARSVIEALCGSRSRECQISPARGVPVAPDCR